MPLNVKSAKPPTGTVPAPEANGAPMGVGGFAVERLVPLQDDGIAASRIGRELDVLRDVDRAVRGEVVEAAGIQRRVHGREVQIRARPRSRVAGTIWIFESYACVAGRLPAEEKYDTPFATTSSTACATMPSWKNGSSR